MPTFYRLIWKKNLKAFTLIELLIVVAIIAILAAIAVPNFLEAQTRAKVARVHADMRSLATGLETYITDYNMYPPSQRAYGTVFDPTFRGRLVPLTTPIAYITSIFDDPFKHGNETNPNDQTFLGHEWTPYVYLRGDFTIYENNASYRQRLKSKWVLVSSGPDNILSHASYMSREVFEEDTSKAAHFSRYDPTNGTVSRGDVYRFGGTSEIVAQ